MKAATVPIISLQEDPKIKLLSWSRSVDNRAASLCSQYYPNGLLHFGITIPDARWNPAHPGVFQADPGNAANMQFMARPELPARPGDDYAVTQAGLYLRKYDEDKFHTTCEAIALLKQEIIASLGSVISEEIEDLTEGYHAMTVLQIVTRITERYGTINEREVRQIRGEMEQPFTTGTTLAQQITTLRKRMQLLAHAGQSLSQAEQMFLLERVTIHLANVQRSIQGYKDLHPLLLNQTFRAMTDYAIEHEFTAPTASAYVAKMKLEEAAEILGVSVDTPIDSLKQIYRRLALHWHPDKNSKPNAKDKFHQISAAYTRLISSHAGSHKTDVEFDSETVKSEENSHEMAAFMRMFMDLVGMFNDDQTIVVDGKIPPPGVSFGMMFGSHTAEEWSTDDDIEIDEEDDDDDDEEYDEDYYDSEGENEHRQSSRVEELPSNTDAIWEPQAKNYSHMNLKEEASRQRQRQSQSQTRTEEEEAQYQEELKRQKNAKKRAEKKRKQKEKKQKKAEEELQLRKQEELRNRRAEEAAAQQRLIQEVRHRQQVQLLEAIDHGEVAIVRELIETGVDVTHLNKKATLETLLAANHVRSLIPVLPLLHRCVPPAASSGTPDAELPGKLLDVAKYLLSLKNPSVNVRTFDDDGLSVLHLAARRGNIDLMKLLMTVRDENLERKTEIDINLRCNRQGWTPLHYAASKADATMCRLLMESGSQLSITAGSNGKGHTPLELVRGKLQNGSQLTAAQTTALQTIAKEFSEAIRLAEQIRLQKEAERLEKEEKLKEEKRKQAEKEAKERELLERKQRQLKEKERLREMEEEARKSKLVGTTVKSTASAPTAAIQNVAVAAAASSAAPCELDDSGTANATSAKKKKKKEKQTNAGAKAVNSTSDAPEVTSTSALAAALDVASRDEMLDHLLSMGFSESDCLAAMVACGKNLDAAITWLCERPPAAAAPSASTKAASSKTPTKVVEVTQQSPKVTVKSASQTSQEEAKLKHKEELRRINRAWNAKAEDEMKKAEQDQKQKEAEKLREKLLLQQQQQQQLHLQKQQQQQIGGQFGSTVPAPSSTSAGFPPRSTSSAQYNSHHVASYVQDQKSAQFNSSSHPVPVATNFEQAQTQSTSVSVRLRPRGPATNEQVANSSSHYSANKSTPTGMRQVSILQNPHSSQHSGQTAGHASHQNIPFLQGSLGSTILSQQDLLSTPNAANTTGDYQSSSWNDREAPTSARLAEGGTELSAGARPFIPKFAPPKPPTPVPLSVPAPSLIRATTAPETVTSSSWGSSLADLRLGSVTPVSDVIGGSVNSNSIGGLDGILSSSNWTSSLNDSLTGGFSFPVPRLPGTSDPFGSSFPSSLETLPSLSNPPLLSATDSLLGDFTMPPLSSSGSSLLSRLGRASTSDVELVGEGFDDHFGEEIGGFLFRGVDLSLDNDSHDDHVSRMIAQFDASPSKNNNNSTGSNVSVSIHDLLNSSPSLNDSLLGGNLR